MKKEEYAATYRGGKFGNTTVHVVAPPPKTEAEIKKILKEFHQAAWDIWTSLSVEEQLKINEEAMAKKA